MARVETKAAERKAQRDATVEQVAAETGQVMTVRDATAYRRNERTIVTLNTLTSQVEVDLSTLDHIGSILAAIKDFRIQSGGYATLQLVTDGRSYSDILTAAALLSQSHNLIIDLHLTPKPQMDDDDDAESAYTSGAIRVGG